MLCGYLAARSAIGANRRHGKSPQSEHNSTPLDLAQSRVAHPCGKRQCFPSCRRQPLQATSSFGTPRLTRINSVSSSVKFSVYNSQRKQAKPQGAVKAFLSFKISPYSDISLICMICGTSIQSGYRAVDPFAAVATSLFTWLLPPPTIIHQGVLCGSG